MQEYVDERRVSRCLLGQRNPVLERSLGHVRPEDEPRWPLPRLNVPASTSTSTTSTSTSTSTGTGALSGQPVRAGSSWGTTNTLGLARILEYWCACADKCLTHQNAWPEYRVDTKPSGAEEYGESARYLGS